jgi:glycosyltransferase involved in cell wall biosynthesis
VDIFMEIDDIKNKKIFFATYSTKNNSKRIGGGPAQHLIDFFVPKAERFTILEQPYFLYTNDLAPTVEIYCRGKLEKSYKFFKISKFFFLTTKKRKQKGGTSFRNKIRDFFSVFNFFLRERRKYDLYIGMESVNALCGIILRKIGFIKKTVYYLFDFTPRRYKNRFINAIYIWLDRFCCYHADFVWNISEAYVSARINELHYQTERMAKQITLNYGVDELEIRNENELSKNQLVFTGSIGEENGVLLLIDMMPSVLKEIPDAKLVIAGFGPQEEILKDKIKSLELERNVEFLGYISERKEIKELQSRSCLALAPYPDLTDSTKKYGDVMKVREYFASGLPVVTTAIPPVSKIIDKLPAGIVVDFNEKSFASAVIRLLSDGEFYRQCRKNAISLAQGNTWEGNLRRAIGEMEF